jgi:hypothetical protein
MATNQIYTEKAEMSVYHLKTVETRSTETRHSSKEKRRIKSWIMELGML